jgi:hypothetical protein
VRVSAPMWISIFLMAALGGRWFLIFDLLMGTAFATSTAWLIWHMRSKRILNESLPIALIGAFMAFAAGSVVSYVWK